MSVARRERLAASPVVALLVRQRSALGVGAVFAGAASWLALDYSARIRDWGVMTDELQYVRLALSAAERHSPLPVIHGQLVGSLNQLYPLLIAPLYGTLDAPTAFRAAHILNAPLMASAAVPAYLLAREVVDRLAALAVALLSVVLVWMVLSGFLMTEVVAYPAFLWAMLAIQRAVRSGSWRRDLVALAGIALALLARTQFAFLAAVLPLAVVGHELGYRPAGGRPDSRRAALRAALLDVVGKHRLLAVVYAAGAVGLALLAVFGSVSSILGSYSVTTAHGSLLPAGVWESAAAHLDSMAIGCGLLPLVLGGGWALVSLVRPSSARAHAFAMVTVAAVLLLALESASFDIRFGGALVVRDRYVFYVVPLLLAGTAALLRERRRPWIAPIALTVLFAATVHSLELPPEPGLWVDSPTRILNDLIAEQAGSLGPNGFVAWTGLFVGVCAVLAVRYVPRALLAPSVFGLLLAVSLFTTLRAIDHTLGGASPSGRGMSKDPGVTLDWVDRVIPSGAQAALVPFPSAPSLAADLVLWWDTEFWNRKVSQAYVDRGGDFRYTPFPTRTLSPDWKTGIVPGTENAPQYVVVAAHDPRLRFAAHRIGANYGLEILAPSRPYRVAWLTRGLQPDGWTTPGRPATLRLFAAPRSPVEVALYLRAPESRARYALRANGSTVPGVIAGGGSRTQQLRVCPGGSGYADVELTGRSSARVPDVQRSFAAVGTRLVGVSLAAVAIRVGNAGSC
jgi:hypothetical protein